MKWSQHQNITTYTLNVAVAAVVVAVWEFKSVTLRDVTIHSTYDTIEVTILDNNLIFHDFLAFFWKT